MKVVCRVRPLNEKERASGDESVVKFPSSSCVALGVSRERGRGREREREQLMSLCVF